MQHLAISRKDAEALRGLDLSFPIAHISSTEGKLSVERDGVTLTPPQIYLATAACAYVSEEGKQDIDALEAFYSSQFGAPPPERIDLLQTRAPQRRDVLAGALLTALNRRTDGQAQRNAALTRDIAQLRQQHAQVQGAFSRLERYVYDQRLNHRQRALEILPAQGSTPLELLAGEVLEQRLPRESTGICDIEISLDLPKTLETGVLTATLWTAEDEREQAQWQIGCDDLSSGWLRLTLPRALDEDARTPMLRLEWDGENPIGLDWSVRHPDPRFQASLGGNATGKTLALRSWTYVAGSEAPPSSDGILPGAVVKRRFMISETELAAAEKLTPECEHFKFLPEHGALMVHIVATGAAVARLPEAIRPGVAHVSACIQTLAEKAPDIEYAIAVAPVVRQRTATDPLPHFRRDDITPWVTLSAMEAGELHLYLSAPVEAASHLYLMVRPAPNAKDLAWGWSTFSAITVET